MIKDEKKQIGDLTIKLYELLDWLVRSPISDKDFDTLGGIVMHHFARFPKPNDAINIEGWRFVINSLERRRIKRIKVSKIN